uniref:Amidase domain-containing protein n=1 Tax=Meloidogyne javanica TaxID=6303 RepID=A0A915LL08_MELJA
MTKFLIFIFIISLIIQGRNGQIEANSSEENDNKIEEGCTSENGCTTTSKTNLNINQDENHEKLKSRDLVLAYIERLKIVNETVNGLTQNNTNALELAERCDEELANITKEKRNELAKTKPLFGVPFTVKANIEVKGFITSCCNLYEMNNPPSTVEATVVTRLLEAGAIILGITTMPNNGVSWAVDDSACGVVNNPHDTRRMSGGSSGGEGVLVASAGSLFGIGNDIGGSVRIPAYMNGIFGLKPTSFPNHTIPVEGILPKFTDYQPASEMLTMGPLVRYASDLPLIMSAKLDLSKLKLFYLEDLDVLISEGLHDEQRNVIRLVKNFFETKHQIKAQKVQFPLMNRVYELWGLTGFSNSTFGLTEIPSLVKQVYSGKSNYTFIQLELSLLQSFTAPKDSKELEFVANKKQKLRDQLNNLLGKDGILLLPIWPTPPPFHHIEPFTPWNVLYTLLFNVLGCPAISVPVGKSRQTNLPLGVQFISSTFNEEILIGMARFMEKSFGGWVKPGHVSPTFLNNKMSVHDEI